MNFIENETAEKLRGGYYTSPDIADFLSRWILATRPRAILEPSCGDGAFLRALGAHLSGRRARVTACEIDAREAQKAREAAAAARLDADVRDGDFLAWTLARLEAGAATFDAVVGNPPFVRYQYLTKVLQDRSERLIRRFGLRFTRHTNAWVPFVVAALAQLREGGRLAMVVPAELLHVLHAESARKHLLGECSRVLILDPEEIWFEETLQGVVLLMAEKRAAADPPCAGRLAVVRTRGRAFMSDDPNALFERAEYLPGDDFPSKWTAALLTARERAALAEVRQHRDVKRFTDVATAAVGIVTGANKFFLVTDDVVRDFDLSAYAHPMFGRSEHVPGVVYDARTHAENRRAGFPTNFLWFDPVAASRLPPGARRYIARGEEARLHTRFKCRIRTPWYTVPSVFATPLAMLKRSHDHPRLVLNAVGAYTTDTAYRVTPRGETRAIDLAHNFVNSLTALSAELEGRHYGGGVLELVPSEIAKLLVPVAPASPEALQKLDASFRARRTSAEILDEQDRAIFGALGVSRTVQAELHDAWAVMRSRRQRVTAAAVEGDDEDDLAVVDPSPARAVANG